MPTKRLRNNLPVTFKPGCLPQRSIFKTPVKKCTTVGCIGFGGWGIGGQTRGNTSYGATEDSVSRDALRKALAEGVTLFDTSPAYGDGRSECLIGEALEPNREESLICTKAGVETWGQKFNFEIESIKRSLYRSLRRLKTSYVDILLLHSPLPEIFAEKKLFLALDRLKDSGKIREWGISCKGPHDAIAALDRHDVRLFQVNFNMLDLRALNSGLLNRTAESEIGVIARTPLNFGFLTGVIDENTQFKGGDHRLAWSRDQVAAWAEGARKLMAITGTKPGDEACIAAIRFCLSFPGISVVLPGAQTPEEVKIHCAAGRLGPLPPEVLMEILSFSNRTTFFLQ